MCHNITHANNEQHQQDPVGVWPFTPLPIPFIHPRTTMVIHWKLIKMIQDEYSFRFAWTPADHEERDDGYESMTIVLIK